MGTPHVAASRRNPAAATPPPPPPATPHGQHPAALHRALINRAVQFRGREISGCLGCRYAGPYPCPGFRGAVRSGARQCSAPAPTGQPARVACGLRGSMARFRPSWALAAVLAVFQGGSLSGRGRCAARPPIAGKVAWSRARRAIPQGSSRMRRAAQSPARAWASGFSTAGGKNAPTQIPYAKTAYFDELANKAFMFQNHFFRRLQTKPIVLGLYMANS